MGGRAKLSKWGWTWLGVVFACFLLSCLLGWFDTSTTLAPDHSRASQFAFIVACTFTVMSAIFLFRQSSGGWLSRAVLCLFVAPLMTFLGMFMLITEALTLIANGENFPSAKSHRSIAVVQIDRAYRTMGKTRTWNIQATPVWSDIEITRADYDYMLTHRRPGDQTSDDTAIASDGYFCAKVEIEQAGGALRILHAGWWPLPDRSIGLCSVLTGAYPPLPPIG